MLNGIFRKDIFVIAGLRSVAGHLPPERRARGCGRSAVFSQGYFEGQDMPYTKCHKVYKKILLTTL
jgi:hypothetical protein